MELRLEDARERPLAWAQELHLKGEELERLDVLSLSPVESAGELRWLDPGFLLSGDASWQQRTACTRCLEPCEESLQVDFQVVLKPETSSPVSEVTELELEADDLNVVLIKGDTVETSDFVLEQMVLALPMKPLCREDCAGLCSVCGKDLNSGKCDCAAASDPRWGALAGLRDRMPDA